MYDQDLVILVIEGPFTTQCQWWSAVLLYERFVVTAFAMLVSDPLWRGLALLACCVAMLALGVWFRPFRAPHENRLYCAGLVLLALIAALSLPSRVRQSLAASTRFTNDKHNAPAMVWLQFALSVLPIVAFAGARAHSAGAAVRRSTVGKRFAAFGLFRGGSRRGVLGDVTLETGIGAERS